MREKEKIEGNKASAASHRVIHLDSQVFIHMSLSSPPQEING